MMLKDTTISLMNSLGEQRIPFLFIINYKGDNCIVKPLKEVDESLIKYTFNEVSNHTPENINTKIDLKARPLSFNEYKTKFNLVKEHFQLGNTYLTNLTVATPITLNTSLEEVYHSTKAKYKLWVKNTFTCFSPEIFVRIQNNTISSYPMKGTIDASLPNAEEKLLQDPKEKAEHYTIVDLIRNDLNIIAKNVQVKRFRYIDRIDTATGAILQTSSEVQGTLPTNWHGQIGSMLDKLLPAGSITGSPKERTIKIIQDAEQYHRNFYTGIAGIYDGNSLDSTVLIRFIEQEGSSFIYKSGGGLTSSSIAKNEYEELLQKIYIPN